MALTLAVFAAQTVLAGASLSSATTAQQPGESHQVYAVPVPKFEALKLTTSPCLLQTTASWHSPSSEEQPEPHLFSASYFLLLSCQVWLVEAVVHRSCCAWVLKSPL